jgi:anti-sigma factor RsiW
MSDDISPDDELLSAYLDDELTPEERARVEARLAADPAARQLLDELRSVSQAVRSLPQESLPADLSESVLRRAERAMLSSDASTAGESASAGGVGGLVELARKLPFGRSLRAWAWAGTAIAAGLLIMIFDRDADQNANLPEEVAVRDRADVRKPLPPLVFQSREEPRSSETAPSPVVPEASSTIGLAVQDHVSESIDESTAARQPESPASVAELRANQFEDAAGKDLSQLAVVGDGRVQGGSGGGAIASTSRSSREVETSDDRSSRLYAEETPVDLLVVHVNAKPEAIEQKLIDRVLTRNGIIVEEQPPADDAGKLTEGESLRLGSEVVTSRAQRQFDFRGGPEALAESAPNQPVDVVLVEAERSQIDSCLSEIDADHSNYFGIAVDDERAASERSSDESQSDWKQYNRGMVPGQQKLQVAADKNLYLESNGQQLALGRAGYALIPAVEEPAGQAPAARALSGEDLARSRAVRMQAPSNTSQALQTDAWGVKEPTASSGQPVAGAEVRFDDDAQPPLDLARRSMAKIVAKADTLQVLFVFTCQGEQSMPAAPATSTPPPSAVP